MMWLIITVAVCFMLSCVMLISGNGEISGTKKAIQNTFIEGELTSSVQDKAISYYDVGDSAMAHFDEIFVSEYTSALTSALQAGLPEEQAAQAASMSAYAAAAGELKEVYLPNLISEMGYEDDSDNAKEIEGIVFYVLNPLQKDGSFMFDSFYAERGETPLHYTDLLAGISDAAHADERGKYVMHNSSVFLADNLVQPENTQTILDALSSYGVTAQQYDDFGFSDYSKVKSIAQSAVVNYRGNLEYRLDNLEDGESVESVKDVLKNDASVSLLSSLPKEVSDALEEVGQMDMYGVMISTIFFKMAGLLLPIIYMIMTANALIVDQVDSGSMAYILSTSVKRDTVTFTQALYLVGSLFAMFVCTSVTSIVCLNVVDVNTALTWQKLLLINLGAFLCMFAMSGICYLASCWFDRSQKAMAVGGGLSMFFLVATMLGLFGSSIMPAIIRMKALDYFNHFSLITLFDTISIMDGTTTYLWKFGILAAIGLVCYIVGSVRFKKKDLPL